MEDNDGFGHTELFLIHGSPGMGLNPGIPEK